MMMVLSYYKYFKKKLDGLDCIVAFESAADMMGLSNGGYREKIQIYTTEMIVDDEIECYLVKSYDDIDFFMYHGDIKCTTENQTIIDMLKNENSDEQILAETLGNYYYENDQSFQKLNIPNKLRDKFDKYSEWGKEYYDI